MTTAQNCGTLVGKVLAVDVGLARIGVATCDPLQLAARPLLVIQRRSRRDDFERLAALIKEHEAVAVVVGLPLNMDGSAGPQAQSVRKWADRLAYALRALSVLRPIIFWDERLSTFDAQQIMAESTAKMEEDAAAAAVILQRFIDAQRQTAQRVDQVPQEERLPWGQVVLYALAENSRREEE